MTATSRFRLGALGLLLFGALWQLAVLSHAVPADLVPGPLPTLRDLIELAGLVQFWQLLGRTLTAATLGLALSVVIAVPVGLACALSATTRRLLTGMVEALRPIPPIVVLPLALLVLGGSLRMQLLVIMQGALWPLLVQTSYGARTLDPVLLDTARSFGIIGLRRLALVRLPAAAPMIAGGLRLAASIAFAVTVVTELVGGMRGVGTVLLLAGTANNVVRVYSATLVIGLVGLAIAVGLTAFETRAIRWTGAATR